VSPSREPATPTAQLVTGGAVWDAGTTESDLAGPGATGPGATAAPSAAGPSPTSPAAAPGEPGGSCAGSASRPADPPWTRPALAVLLIVTAAAYLWDLSRNGWGNTFYAAAVQSGTKSWSAFFFGSFDWSNYITVDKPPVSLWIMALSGRIFGFSSWSMLAPQALLGVGSVALLFAAVRRVWGAPAGLLSGAVLAATPAAALMFRFNNPDAALTFFLVAAAYTLTRALERASTRWLLLTAALVGTAFLAKSLQALLVVPGLGLAYLVAAPAGWRRRSAQLAGSLVVLAVSSLWWPVLVDAIPAGSRPFIGGSTTNSVLQLALGYNGLDRLTGGEGPGGGFGGGPGGGFGGGFGGAAGLGRLFNGEFSGFIAWLLPAALIGLAAGVWLVRRAPRTDARWGSLLLWGGWTLVTGGVLSFMGGIVHSYYTVALAPGVAALAGMVVPALWHRRTSPVARLWLAAIAAAAALAGYVLLGQAEGWLPWLRAAVVIAGAVGTLLILAPLAVLSRFGPGVRRRLAGGGAALALVAGLAGPVAWSAATIDSTHTGSVPQVGPVAAAGRGGPGGVFAAGPGVRYGYLAPGDDGAQGSGGPEAGIQVPGEGQVPGGSGLLGGRSEGFAGGPASAGTADQALVTLLRHGASGYRWVAAASSSQTAGPLQLAVDAPVMSIGGFSGGDAAITLERFQQLVSQHKIHYFVADGRAGGPGGRGPGGRGALPSIATWVGENFTATTVGGATVHDLTTAATGGGSTSSACSASGPACSASSPARSR